MVGFLHISKETLAPKEGMARSLWSHNFMMDIMINWGEEFYTNKLLSYLNCQKVRHHFHTGEEDKQTTSIPVLGTKQVWRKIGRVVKWNENACESLRMKTAERGPVFSNSTCINNFILCKVLWRKQGWKEMSLSVHLEANDENLWVSSGFNHRLSII